MNNLEILETDESFSDYGDLICLSNETCTESANGIVKYNRCTPLIKFVLSGTMLLASTCQDALADNIAFTDNHETIEAYLSNYKQNIDFPMSDYLNQVNQICLISKYSKNDLIKQIISFKSLESNWDGFSAVPLEIESAANSIIFLELIGENSYNKLDEFFPNPNGTISFIWTNKSNEIISLEIGNKKMSYYVELNSKETIFCNNKEINNEEIKKLSEFIQVL